MTAQAGELVTESFDYDGGRAVTAYGPPDAVENVVFAADGGWHLRDADARVSMHVREGGHGDGFWFTEFPLMGTWASGDRSRRPGGGVISCGC